MQRYKIIISNNDKEFLERVLFDEDRGDLVAILSNELTTEEVDDICETINDQFIKCGLLDNYEPNQYGLELEELLDKVNRCRLI